MSQKNIAHSIFQRLLNRAKANKEDFNLLLSRYGMERFLYRLSISPCCDRFILKGASLFLVWEELGDVIHIVQLWVQQRLACSKRRRKKVLSAEC